jgi:hypothetical protein
VPSETGGAPVATALYVSVPGVSPPAGAGATVLVQADDDALWLLTEGRRYALEPAVRDLLGLPRQPVRLPREIIATVPEGPRITIPDAGAAGGAPDADLPFDAAIGDLAHTRDGTVPQYFLVRPDGLVPVSGLVHTLLAGQAGADHAIGVAQAARAPRSAGAAPGDPAWPQGLPVAAELQRDQPVCVSTPPGGRPGDAPWQATVHVPPALPEPPDAPPVEAADGGRLGLLDRIHVPAGSGAVVRATASAGSGGTHTLVTDGGTAYPFVSADAVTRLGYDPAGAPSVPSAYVRLLPAGPLLDPAAAAREQRGGNTQAHTGEDR